MYALLKIQEAYSNIFSRQSSIKELQYTDDGIGAYIGTLAPSSSHYFNTDTFIKHITLDSILGLPDECPMSCSYCPNYKEHVDNTINDSKGSLSMDDRRYLKNDALNNYNPNQLPLILFGGATDPLLYHDTIIDIMNFYTESVEPHIDQEIWFHSYTTGVFLEESALKALADNGLKEIIFHLGASGFSDKAYDSIKMARKHIEVVTIETPSWVHHKQKLFDMLPIINDIGVDHLNLTSIDINNNNKNRLSGNVYKVYNMVLDDDGLVYDIMQEVIDKNYKYSVLDLNNFVVMNSQGEARSCTL